jgi:hypothetical protein
MVNLSAEQRTTIQRTVLARNDVPRVHNVNFSLRVGTVVPRSVRIVPVVATLVEIDPAFRDHYYFVAYDDIVIVDRDYRIVSLVPVGSSGSMRTGSYGTPRTGMPGGGSRASGSSMTLSREEIRQVQIMLQQQGFDIEIDGVLGAKTRQVLVQFQQQHGLQVTGQIDQRTMSELKVAAQGPGQQPSTTGQGGNQQKPQPSAGEPDQTGRGNTNMNPPAGAAQPGANDERDNNMQQPPANREPPATTGQSGRSDNDMRPPQDQPQGTSRMPQNNPNAGGTTPAPDRQQR